MNDKSSLYLIYDVIEEQHFSDQERHCPDRFSISCCLPPYSSPQNKCKRQDRQSIAKAEHRIHQRHQRLCTPAFSSNNIYQILEVLWLCTPAVPTRTSSSSDRPQNRPALAFFCLVSSQQKEHCQFFCH